MRSIYLYGTRFEGAQHAEVRPKVQRRNGFPRMAVEDPYSNKKLPQEGCLSCMEQRRVPPWNERDSRRHREVEHHNEWTYSPFSSSPPTDRQTPQSTSSKERNRETGLATAPRHGRPSPRRTTVLTKERRRAFCEAELTTSKMTQVGGQDHFFTKMARLPETIKRHGRGCIRRALRGHHPTTTTTGTCAKPAIAWMTLG